MARGPYERPPRRPDYPVEQPTYVAPEHVAPEYLPPPRRAVGIAEIVAVLALVAAAVAIFIAIDARQKTADNQHLSRQLREEIQRQVRGVRSSVGQQAGSAGARARQAEAEARQTRRRVSELTSNLLRLQEAGRRLQGQQTQMRETLQKQSETISALRRSLGE